MKLRNFSCALAIAIAASIAGCSSSGGNNSDGGTTDSSDGGTSSAGTDTGATEAGSDAGTTEAGSDAGSTDSDGGTTGTDSGTSTGGEGTNDLSAVAGLWDASEVEDGLLDVFYVEIFSDGNVISYDYLGDEYDAAENCYEYFSFTGENLGNNQYRFNGEVITLSVSNGVLSGVDSEGAFSFPAVTEFTSAEFNACT